MNRNILINIPLQSTARKLLFLACFSLFLMLAGCTSTHNSQKNWNRTPASTGHNKCGCLLNPASEYSIKLYQQPVYALQA